MKILVKSTQKELEPNFSLPVRQDIKLVKKKLLQGAFKQREGKSPTLYIKSYLACILFNGTPILKKITIILNMYNVYQLSFRC